MSKTPGRTQHINFFDLGQERFLVDLPGYGFANVPEAVRAHWVELLGRYLGERQSLIGLLLIMDARHPLKDLDLRMLNYIAPTGRPVHILLSKADKLSRQEQTQTLRMVKAELAHWNNVSVQLFSSLKKQGMDTVEDIVKTWFDAEDAHLAALMAAADADADDAAADGSASAPA